jgi:hypothetical protein
MKEKHSVKIKCALTNDLGCYHILLDIETKPVFQNTFWATLTVTATALPATVAVTSINHFSVPIGVHSRTEELLIVHKAGHITQ